LSTRTRRSWPTGSFLTREDSRTSARTFPEVLKYVVVAAVVAFLIVPGRIGGDDLGPARDAVAGAYREAKVALKGAGAADAPTRSELEEVQAKLAAAADELEQAGGGSDGEANAALDRARRLIDELKQRLDDALG
jgi:hypothetical protein